MFPAGGEQTAGQSIGAHLESHVLQEVSRAIVGVGLKGAAGVDPDTNGGGLPTGVLGCDTEAGAEGGYLGRGVPGTLGTKLHPTQTPQVRHSTLGVVGHRANAGV